MEYPRTMRQVELDLLKNKMVEIRKERSRAKRSGFEHADEAYRLLLADLQSKIDRLNEGL